MSLGDYLKEALGNPVRRVMRELEHELSRSVTRQVHLLQRRIIRGFASVLVMLVAGVFLSAAAIFFFIEYVQLSKTLSFLIVGITLLFIGLIVRLIK